MIRHAPRDDGPRRDKTSGVGFLAGVSIAVTLIMIWLIGANASSKAERVFPLNAVEAKRVLAAAKQDAREHPSDGKAQLAFGLSLMHLRHYPEAVAVLEHAEVLLPDDPWPSNALGWTLIRQEQYRKALPHLQRAVRIDSTYASAYHNLGWTLMQLNRYAEAEEAYEVAQKLEPENAGLAFEYGWALFQQRKSDRAIVEMLHATSLDSTAAVYHSTAGYFLRSKARFPEAKAEFERAVSLDSRVAFIWAELGVTDFLMADTRGAERAFANASRIDPRAVPEGSMQRNMWDSARKGVTVPAELVTGAQMPMRVPLERAP